MKNDICETILKEGFIEFEFTFSAAKVHQLFKIR